eukprot:TRINITY_DN3034_c0_g1_i4.p1 TRINITY_DN3034_c0_g1~~TRINITY_DN3034_c0_g1_i4.p1  ORF type:complete len:175 (-),score=18.18 TRINITY_DN3034_c0_g1_i4:431-955(-)
MCIRDSINAEYGEGSAALMSGPPPLEDMSDSLSAVKSQREQRQMESDRHRAYVNMMKSAHEKVEPKGTNEGAKLLTCAGETRARAQESVDIRANGTCGMKKGFFDAPKKTKSKDREEMEVIRPKEKPKPKGKIDGFEMPKIDVSANQVNDVLDMGSKSPDGNPPRRELTLIQSG